MFVKSPLSSGAGLGREDLEARETRRFRPWGVGTCLEIPFLVAVLPLAPTAKKVGPRGGDRVLLLAMLSAAGPGIGQASGRRSNSSAKSRQRSKNQRSSGSRAGRPRRFGDHSRLRVAKLGEKARRGQISGSGPVSLHTSTRSLLDSCLLWHLRLGASRSHHPGGRD